jgi:Domain of unknown function (DUF4982)
VIPHWNWAGSEGKPIKIMVATNAESVALFLNGNHIAEKLVDRYEMVTFDVPYMAGTLEARALNGGKEVARFDVETTGAPSAIRLTPDRKSMAGTAMTRSPLRWRTGNHQPPTFHCDKAQDGDFAAYLHTKAIPSSRNSSPTTATSPSSSCSIPPPRR